MANKAISDHSRTQWTIDTPDANPYPGDENIKLGCLQRIAAATELMANNHQQLVDERDRYKRNAEYYESLYAAELRSVRAYKAHNTRASEISSSTGSSNAAPTAYERRLQRNEARSGFGSQAACRHDLGLAPEFV